MLRVREALEAEAARRREAEAAAASAAAERLAAEVDRKRAAKAEADRLAADRAKAQEAAERKAADEVRKKAEAARLAAERRSAEEAATRAAAERQGGEQAKAKEAAARKAAEATAQARGRAPAGASPLLRLDITAREGKFGVVLTEYGIYCAIKDIVAGGAADLAGLRVGDLVLALDDRDCTGLKPSAITGLLKEASMHAVSVRRPLNPPKTRAEVDAMPTFAGDASRFVDNRDGTVTDRGLGLTWQLGDSGKELDWRDAKAYAQGLRLGGHSDWRLPTIAELRSLVDKSRAEGKKIAGTFGDYSGWCWSATAYSGSSSNAWGVHFSNGYSNNVDITNSYRVRCVR